MEVAGEKAHVVSLEARVAALQDDLDRVSATLKRYARRVPFHDGIVVRPSRARPRRDRVHI
eukprot:scaffold500304_cov18-Prasinocladus_malaysianus.AAC.1